MQTASDASQVPASFISVKEFARRSTLSRAELYNRINSGELPKPWRLSANRVAWPIEVWDRWAAQRVAENMGAAA